jgi:protein-S-isoprenylcysteine O-methyltransferase Ste14
VRATVFEFRYRMFFLCAIYLLAYLSYRIDPVPAAQGAAQLVGTQPTAFLWLGTGLTLAAAVIRTWASAYLGAHVVGDSTIRSESLVADGPFRYVRNPLYLGLIIFAIGLGLTASRMGWFIIVGGTILFLMRLLLREESELMAKQGEPYRAFLAAVPRLVPSLHPRVAAGNARPRWGQAFGGEIMMWAITASMAALAITGDAELFRWAALLSFAAYALSRVARRLIGGGRRP